jgi:hypothetical protein
VHARSGLVSDDVVDLLGAGIVAQTDADRRVVSWRAES